MTPFAKVQQTIVSAARSGARSTKHTLSSLVSLLLILLVISLSLCFAVAALLLSTQLLATAAGSLLWFVGSLKSTPQVIVVLTSLACLCSKASSGFDSGNTHAELR